MDRTGWTAKELADRIIPGDDSAEATTLAARVMEVLAIEPRRWTGWDCCLAEVLRILNGEEL